MAERSASRRRCPRFPVVMSCSLQSDLWDEPVSLRVSELSAGGVWVESDVALEQGDEVVVALELPGAAQPVWAVGQVARVGFHRRRVEGKRSGMGLSLAYVREADATRVEGALTALALRDALAGADVHGLR
jgi:Tfp pilus assembly protein PilZ